MVQGRFKGRFRKGQTSKAKSVVLRDVSEEIGTLVGCIDLMEQLLEEAIKNGEDIRSNLKFSALDDHYHVLIETRYLGKEISGQEARYQMLQNKLTEYLHSPRERGTIRVGSGGIKTVRG